MSPVSMFIADRTESAINEQLLIAFVLLISLAMVAGIIEHSRAAASPDGRLPKSVEILEVSPSRRITLRENQPAQGGSVTRPLVPDGSTELKVRLGASLDFSISQGESPWPEPHLTALAGTGLQDPPDHPEPDAATHEQVNQALFNLPLRFIANAGQTDPTVHFTVKGAGHTIFFTGDEVVFSASAGRRTGDEGQGIDSSMDLIQPPTQNSQPETQTSVVRLGFLGADPHPVIEGLSPMSGVANFFLGNDPVKWQVNVPIYGAVAYRDLYPGIALVYRGTEGRLKSEFHLASGADPALIQMAYSGVEEVCLREDGVLVLQTPLGELIEEVPLIYQEVDGVRREIPGGYLLLSPSPSEGEGRGEGDTYRVGFDVGAYDPTLPLVIDPELTYSTYLGGNGEDHGHGIAVDSEGNAYVVGRTGSSDFPIHNAIQSSYGGGGVFGTDAFVTQIVGASGVYTHGYSTYLGGSGNDGSLGIAVDNDGNVYVAGSTDSSDFPTRNAIQATHANTATADAFVTQIISASGVYTLAYSTYLGGGGVDWGWDIAVDGAGNAHVTGVTSSSDFPTNTNAIQPSCGGGGIFGGDAFVTQIISTSGFYTYGYSTYLGGIGDDEGWAIAVDSVGNAYVTGYTESGGDFPTTINAIQPSYGGGVQDAFVTQIISASGFYTYGYSTYLGGDGFDLGRGIAVDGAGNAYVTGQTQSSDFPTTNAIQPNYYGGGGEDAFVTKIISVSGVYAYGYSTYLGGDSIDIGNCIAVDDAGNAYVAGFTRSSDFPIRNAMQTDQGGDDAFVTQIISASGFYTYGYSTYLGGGSYDGGYGIAVDSVGNVYVMGGTASSDFPTCNAMQTTYGGDNYDAFVAKITVGLALSKAVAPTIVAPGQAVTYTLVYINNGVGVASGVLITDVVPITLTNVSLSSSGAQITPTGSVSYTWQVAPLSPGEGGIITITGIVSSSVSSGFTLTNRATITSTDVSYVDTYLDNNTSVVHSTVAVPVYLPLIMQAFP